ncbi:MAG TPA: hypothetical protein VFF39_19695 [Verrucomicrobiae bacterium]|nr:hypothetical protein [Verrucomicrobiae bacterium]
MANSFVVNPTPIGLSHLTNPRIVSLTATIGFTYATATGGITFDFTAPLQSLEHGDFPDMPSGQQGGTFQKGIASIRAVDVLFAVVTAAGTNIKIGQPNVWTRTSTAYVFTCRLYSNLTNTEVADGAETGTMKIFLLVS